MAWLTIIRRDSRRFSAFELRSVEIQIRVNNSHEKKELLTTTTNKTMSTALKGMVEKLMNENGASFQNTEYDVLISVPVQDGTGVKNGASREALEFFLKTKREEMEFYHSWVSKAKVNVCSCPLSFSC